MVRNCNKKQRAISAIIGLKVNTIGEYIEDCIEDCIEDFNGNPVAYDYNRMRQGCH
jgi:hypothetical protein